MRSNALRKESTRRRGLDILFGLPGMTTGKIAGKMQPPEPGTVLAGKYQVEEVVGSGGMGVVVAARHLELRQTVAIKLLLADESQRGEASARFLREARAAAALGSDHVVRIYDLGMLPEGVPFMVMELLRGRDLGRLLDEQGALPIEHAIEYVLQASDAVAEAHAAGIVHRDLKPSNLFVTRRSDGGPLVKVLDFGISKAFAGEHVQGDLTGTQAVLGSPFYMSPEQVRDSRNVDPRSDVWALGVILHELLSGEPVFLADTFPGVCAAIIADPAAPLRRFRPDVPPELEQVVLRCLEKNPEARFQSVTELMQALRPFAPRRASAIPTIPAPAGQPRSVPQTSSAAERVSTDAPTLSYDQIFPRASLRSEPRISQKELVQTHGPVATSEPRISSASGLSRGSSGRRWVVGGAALIGLAAAVVTLGIGRRQEAPPASSQETPPPEKNFKLSVESLPPGAEVREGDRALGTTPLTLEVTPDSLRGGSRTLTLEKPGFFPYAVVQGRSTDDVRIVAKLLTLPAAETPPAPSSQPTSAPRRASPRRETAEKREPTGERAPERAAPDIRLQR